MHPPHAQRLQGLFNPGLVIHQPDDSRLGSCWDWGLAKETAEPIRDMSTRGVPVTSIMGVWGHCSNRRTGRVMYRSRENNTIVAIIVTVVVSFKKMDDQKKELDQIERKIFYNITKF